MKMLISMVLTLGIILFASQYMLKGMGGIPGFGGGTTDDSASGLGELGNAVMEKDVTVYQWKDANGVTHFGGTPPTGQGNYETKQIHANTNLMQAHKSAAEEEESKPSGPRVAKVGSVYSPEGVKDLIDDTKGLKEQMDQRAAEQEKLMESIMNPGGKK